MSLGRMALGWQKDGSLASECIRRMKNPFYRATLLVCHSHHPGSPCGPVSAGRRIAFGHCCRRGRYLQGVSPESGANTSRPHHNPQCELAAVDLLEGKPPPKNILKRSSGEMSASKPRWKSPWPWPCRAAWLLSSPNWSYCFLFSGLLSTAYAVPMAGRGEKIRP